MAKAELPIPRAALDMSAILLAKTRAGKSSTLRTIIEVLDADGERNCIITPKDDWWGLKLGADGKSPGRPFVIFGGEYADVPINGRAGKDIGELVATGNRPCIITLSELSIADRTRFVIDFAETLYKMNRGKIFLTVDECHNFAPKGKLFDPQQAAMLHWMNRLASEGLGRGIVLLSASQRPQKVHNDYLTSHELLVAKKVNHGADRGAIREWAEGSGDKATVNKLVDSLAGLPRSDAWVWCPEIGLGPELVTFPFFTTYDSFKPQEVGSGKKLKGWASVDLAEVEAKLSVVVEEAKANDPKALKAEVTKLRNELAKNPSALAIATPPKEQVDAARACAVRDAKRAYRKMLETAMKILVTITTHNTDAADKTAVEKALQEALSKAMGTVNQQIEARDKALTALQASAQKVIDKISEALASDVLVAVEVTANKPFTIAPAPTSAHRGAAPMQRAPAVRSATGGADHLPAPQRRVLASIGFWLSVGNTAPSRAQVGGVAGYSPSSGGFNNLLGALNTAGLITIPRAGAVALADGAPYDALMAEEARAKVYSVISPPQRKLVDAALDAGDAISRDDLGAATGYSPSSGGFNNLIGSLNTLTIFEKPAPGMVRLSDWAREVLS